MCSSGADEKMKNNPNTYRNLIMSQKDEMSTFLEAKRVM
jgi:hypothetical protein